VSARRQAPDPGPAGRPAPGPAAGVTRRRLLAGAGALGAGILASPVAGGVLAASAGAADDAAGAGSPARVPFYGRHQAGIATAQQRHLVFAGYDLTAGNRAQLGELLATWTAAAARMTAGEPLEGPDRPADPPPDTGEAVGLGPSRLTLTVGFGPGMFDHDHDHDRYGLGHRRPAALAVLPHFPGDELDPARSGGDLCVQSCADSLQVAFHAVHELTRIGLGAVTLRYYQLGFGFGSAGAAPPGVDTPRNLLGFHDGTANRTVEQPGGLDRHVWVGAGTDQPWLRGGTFLVARRVRIGLEAWARTALEDQEAAVGRHKLSGAPLGGRRQEQAPDFAATGPDGRPRIPASAHIRLASPGHNGGAQILRRSYNFADGVDPRTGELDAGLFFICFQRDPARQFARIQGHLAAADALTTGYLRHTASAVFACPPGVAPGRHWGSALGLG
jgi:deferrochelatase/peroxidase EfeB